MKQWTSGNWWITVVLLSIILNVLSAYLKTPLDRFLNFLSKKRLTLNQAKQQRFDMQLKILKKDTTELLFWEIKEIKFFLALILLLIVEGGTLLTFNHPGLSKFYKIPVAIFGLIISILMLIVLNSMSEITKLLNEAHKDRFFTTLGPSLEDKDELENKTDDGT